MNKKKLDTGSITNELKGSSLFFEKPKRKKAQKEGKSKERKVNNDSYQASELSSYRASTIADIRRVILSTGETVCYVRLTKEEKRRLQDIVYSYTRQGLKTTDTQVLRIALAALLDEHEANGKNSLLDKVINALKE